MGNGLKTAARCAIDNPSLCQFIAEGVKFMRVWQRIGSLLSLLALSGCGYNTLQSTEETINAAASEMLNQFQRRADLVPNMVKTVEGFAQQEKAVLLGVTAARSEVGAIRASPERLNNPAAFKQFQRAQDELSGALSRLLVVVERYPDLKSDQNFRDLQAELEFLRWVLNSQPTRRA